MGKQIVLPGVSFPSTLPVLRVRPPATGLLFGIDPDALELPNGTLVDSIPDAAGIHPAATQSVGTQRPTLVHNALGTTGKGLRFDGGDNLILSGTALDLSRNKSRLSVYALAQRDAGTTIAQDILAMTTGSGGARVALGGGATNTQLRAGARRLDADAQSAYATSTDASFAGQIVKLSAHYEWSAGRVVLHVKSPTVTRDVNVALAAGAGSTSDTRSNSGFIGGSVPSASWAGTILSLLVYDSLDDAQLTAAVHQFWQKRYGV